MYLNGLRTGYGDYVSVYASSAAGVPRLWLSIAGEAHLEGTPRAVAGISFGVAPGYLAAHMSVEDARLVRDAIDAWIAERFGGEHHGPIVSTYERVPDAPPDGCHCDRDPQDCDTCAECGYCCACVAAAKPAPIVTVEEFASKEEAEASMAARWEDDE